MGVLFSQCFVELLYNLAEAQQEITSLEGEWKCELKGYTQANLGHRISSETQNAKKILSNLGLVRPALNEPLAREATAKEPDAQLLLEVFFDGGLKQCE
jgi:hypothetical protein